MFSDITPAKIGFIGLGLIGGSVAKAIRTYFPDYELIAFDKNKETLALAVQENIIDTSCSAIDDNFKGCSYIFLCAPVSYNTACLTQLKSLIDPDCILTDVGSVKNFNPRRNNLAWYGRKFYRRSSDGRFGEKTDSPTQKLI